MDDDWVIEDDDNWLYKKMNENEKPTFDSSVIRYYEWMWRCNGCVQPHPSFVTSDVERLRNLASFKLYHNNSSNTELIPFGVRQWYVWKLQRSLYGHILTIMAVAITPAISAMRAVVTDGGHVAVQLRLASL